MKQLLLFLLVFQCLLSSAQKHVIFTNAQEINKERYKDFKGTCFLFEDWVRADLYDNTGADYHDVLINFNSNESNLEANDGEGKVIIIGRQDILRAVVNEIDDSVPEALKFLDSLVLITNPKPELKSTYYIVLHQDDNRLLLLEFNSTISETTQRPPGQIIVNKRFMNKYNLTLIDGDDIKSFTLKKKEIKNAFSKYGDIGKWCKSKKKKITSYEAMVSFLEEKKKN